MTNFVFSESNAEPFWKNKPSPGVYDDMNKTWQKGGDEYKSFKENDLEYVDFFSGTRDGGFVRTNGSLPWSVVFSDMSHSQVREYLPFSGFSSFDSGPINDNEIDSPYFDIYIANAVRGFIFLMDALADDGNYYIGDSMGSCWGTYDKSIIDEVRVSDVCATEVMNVGRSQSKDYTGLGVACKRVLMNFYHPQYQTRYDEFDEVKVDVELNIDSPSVEYMRENWVDFVSWMVTAENEAQKYAQYARRHPPKMFLVAMYEHSFSDEAMDMICKGPIANVYWRGNCKMFDFSEIEKKRLSRVGDRSACPV